MSIYGGLGIKIIKFKNWLLVKSKEVLREDYHY